MIFYFRYLTVYSRVVNPILFQIQFVATEMQVFSDDLREVRSVGCHKCGIVVANDRVGFHVKREHPDFKHKSLAKLVEGGYLELNYQTKHRCHYCYKEMAFTRRNIMSHLITKGHLKWNTFSWREYRDLHLTHSGEPFSQPYIGKQVDETPETLEELPETPGTPETPETPEGTSGGFHPTVLLAKEMETDSPSHVMESWALEDDGIPVGVGTVNETMEAEKPYSCKQAEEERPEQEGPLEQLEQTCPGCIYLDQLQKELEEEIELLEGLLEGMIRRYCEGIVNDLVDASFEEIQKLEEEELEEDKIMVESFVNDLVYEKLEEIQKMEEEELRPNKIMVGQLEDDKQEDDVAELIRRKRIRHGRAGRARGAAARKQKKLDQGNFLDMLFRQPGDVGVRREEARKLFG